MISKTSANSQAPRNSIGSTLSALAIVRMIGERPMRSSTRRLATAAVVLMSALSICTPRVWALEIKRMQLSNGAVLLVSEQHQLPMVTATIAFDAGSRRDPTGKEGLAALTAASLMEGTSTLSAEDFNEKVDFMGSSISIGPSRDFALATFTSLKKYQGDTLHLLAQILQQPGLRDADIERKQAEQIAEIKSSEEEPGYTASVAFSHMIFGDTPYGHPAGGTSEAVAKLKPADVRDFYHQHYKLGSAVIAVAGDVNTDEIKALLEKELTGPEGNVPPQPEPATQAVAPGIHTQIIDRNVAQANLYMGSNGIARSNPDYYKLQVMNYILGGGGFASRLMKVVRSKAGLAYSIGSGFQAGKFPGAFVIALETKNASANEAIKLILQQLREIQESPVSAAELDSAKRYLIGSFPLKLDRQSEIVGFMLQTEIYGLGLDYAERYPKIISAISAADVQAVAQKYLHPDAIDLVAVANQAEAKISVAGLEPPKQAAADH
ncbi:MAG TPA: pitrilysin family protein [Candidatus Binataceae bacterium]|jgi:zinc protease